MRTNFLGSALVTGTPSPVNPAPRRALLPQEGGVADNDPSLSYPFAFSDDGICEVWYRIRRFRVTGSIALNGDPFPGFPVHDTCSATWENIMEHSFEFGGLTEGLLLNTRINDSQFSRPIIWQNSVSDETMNIKETHKAFDFPLEEYDSNTGYTNYLYVSASQNDTDVITPYLFRPATEDWLPSMLFRVAPAFVFHTGCSFEVLTDDSVVAGTGFTLADVTGNYQGNPYPMKVRIPDWATITSFSCDILAYNFHEYRDSTGANPIWDINTGAELQNHSTPTK